MAQHATARDGVCLVIDWRRFEDVSGCWVWTGPIEKDGYGTVRIAGKKIRVHRLVYTLLVGDIPDGLVLDHLCRVRACANPAHLDPVTFAVNSARNSHSLKTECFRGHPFTPENTYVRYGTQRTCRTCNAASARKAYRKKVYA
jgi:hypothetical protein